MFSGGRERANWEQMAEGKKLLYERFRIKSYTCIDNQSYLFAEKQQQNNCSNHHLGKQNLIILALEFVQSISLNFFNRIFRI